MLKKSRRKRKPNNNIPQHHRHDHNHDNSFALPVDPVFEYVQACRHHRLILPRTSIDETFAPNLVRQALNTQHREIFCTWIMMNFPCLYSLYATQVDINILDYMRHYPGALPEALVGAVCALNTLHLSNAHNDPAKVASSRAIYSHGLTRLSAVLQGGMQDRTDDVHLAAILLGFYEILDGTSQRSWLAHSRGITDLFRLRGPALLCSGIGRTLFVSYRSFVVTEAFISRQACLFEEEQWKVMINNTIGTGRAQGKYCWLVTVWEQGLNEIIMCPGYMVRAQGILSHAKPGDKAQKSDLITQIRRSRDELSRAVSQLAIALTAEGEFSEPEDSMGAISADFRHVFIPTSLQSMRTAINLLGRLLNGGRVLKKLRKIPKWEEEWKTLTVRSGVQGIESTPDEFVPHGLDLGQLNIPGAIFLNLLDLTTVSRISDRVFKVKYDGETWILKIAQFRHEIPALQREVSIYSTLTSTGFPLAPKFIGFVYEETKARTVGFLMEEISGKTPDIHNLRDCVETVRLLHTFGILHGDPNKYNFLMTEHGAKIFDFESSAAQGEVDPAAAEGELKSLPIKLEDESGIGRLLIDSTVDIMPLLSLPDETLLEIVSYLESHAHVASLSSQCRRLYRLCDMPNRRKYRRVILRTPEDLIRGFRMLQSILKTPRFGTYVRHLEFDRFSPPGPDVYGPQAQEPPQVSLPPENLSRLERAIDRAGFDINEAERVLNVLLQDLKYRCISHTERAGYFYRIIREMPFYAQALAALLVLFFKHFFDRANGRGHNLPFLQKLRTVRFLVDYLGGYSSYQYQPFDLCESLNLIRRLPAIESVRIDGITVPKRSSIELPPRTANYSKIEIRHSNVNYLYLIHTIRSAKSLKEFAYTIGGYGSTDDSIAMLNPDVLFRSLLEYWETLEYLDLDVEADLPLEGLSFRDYRSQYGPAYFHESEGELGERPENKTHCFLRSFTKLRSLCLGIHLLYYFARGIDDDLLSEEVFSLADRLPPNLESLRIYGYEKGMKPRVKGLPSHIFHDMLSQLLKEKDEKLPRLTHIAGIEELIDHAATLPPQVRPEDIRLVWQREEDQWTEYEY
ncbi:hypothetical protein CDV55_103988 [Aspergillus turcosus]|nr:hypothetical protein CDV55_103988 [Aspergillus turcosus]